MVLFLPLSTSLCSVTLKLLLSRGGVHFPIPWIWVFPCELLWPWECSRYDQVPILETEAETWASPREQLLSWVIALTPTAALSALGSLLHTLFSPICFQDSLLFPFGLAACEYLMDTCLPSWIWPEVLGQLPTPSFSRDTGSGRKVSHTISCAPLGFSAVIYIQVMGVKQ